MLAIPPTIRVPQPSDFPHREDIVDLLQKRKAANITQGFITKPNKTPQLPYAFNADININNNRLWALFLALAGDMPEKISCTYGLYKEDPVTTGNLPKQEMLQDLSRFQQELSMDCSIEFGLLYHTKAALVEVFVTESKYIKFLGSNKDRFLQHMQQFQLKETRNIAFVDEYPKVVIPLRDVMPSARRTEDVIWSLNRAFGVEQ